MINPSTLFKKQAKSPKHKTKNKIKWKIWICPLAFLSIYFVFSIWFVFCFHLLSTKKTKARKTKNTSMLFYFYFFFQFWPLIFSVFKILICNFCFFFSPPSRWKNHWKTSLRRTQYCSCPKRFVVWLQVLLNDIPWWCPDDDFPRHHRMVLYFVLAPTLLPENGRPQFFPRASAKGPS